MTPYLFILGRTPELAFLELQTFFPGVHRVSDDVALSEHPLDTDPKLILSRLGGTVKVASYLGEISTLSSDALVEFIDTPAGRILFGISMYGQTQSISRAILEGAKTLLEEKGASVRFVESRQGAVISSVVVAKEHLQELVVVKKGDKYVVGKTIAVQEFETWGEKDFGRPHADAHAGMLPPKVSRMVVNIADRSRDLGKIHAEKTLLDPFCGMGTILAEGLIMGWNVVGSDISADVVEKAKANVRWITQNYEATAGVTYRTMVSDAVHVADVVDEHTIDAIITEPDMGDTSIAQKKHSVKREDVKNIIKGLEKLYIGCLRNWSKVLKTGGVVMMALPSYSIEDKTYFVKKVIDMCEALGYTILAGPIEYSRPGATVKRNFYLFQKI